MAIEPMPTERNPILVFAARVGRLFGKLDIKNENVATGLGFLFAFIVVIAVISILGSF